MYDPPAYVWAITIAGPTAIAALTCIVLYGGAVRAGLGRRRAALLARGAARRAALRFNAFGLTDLVVALTLGALTGFGLLNVTPSSAPITELPLALIPTATVPLLFALHTTSMRTPARAPRPAPSAAGPLLSAPRRALP